MSKPIGKTGGVLGIVLAVALMLLLLFPVLHLAFPLRMGFHGLPMFWIRGLTLLLMPLVWIAVTVWAYRDAESRGMNGLLWALLVFLGNVIGLVVYLIVCSGGRGQSRLLSRVSRVQEIRRARIRVLPALRREACGHLPNMQKACGVRVEGLPPLRCENKMKTDQRARRFRR